jgi:pimeloyl-ACP methyl ester carboxylesterase
MTTFVLVHGAWNGAHGMRLVRRRLQAHGHEVFTPSLTGIGERVHLAGPQIDLTTHVHDVVNTILYEDLTEIVLLGFSYGGMVVSGALDHVGDRVRHLVLLDAFVPHDGDSVRSLLGAGPPAPIALGEPWAVPATVRRYDDPEEAAFAAARSSPHPAACFTEPVRLARPLEEWPFSRTYVRATADGPDAPGTAAFEAAVARVKGSPAWRYAEIATNHMIAINRPDELVELLLALDER